MRLSATLATQQGSKRKTVTVAVDGIHLVHTSGGQESHCGRWLLVITSMAIQMDGNASFSD